MMHEELVSKVEDSETVKLERALLAVVELHKPRENVWCSGCLDAEYYPCRTIQAIERNLA